MAVDDGGAAFPLSRENEGWFNGGMTLRDYLEVEMRECATCRGSREVRYRKEREFSVVPALPLVEGDIPAPSYHSAPCPDCAGGPVPQERLMVLTQSFTFPKVSAPERDAIARNGAARLGAGMLEKGLIKVELSEPDYRGFSTMRLTAGVVAPDVVANFEERVRERQFHVAEQVIEATVEEIANWGSFYHGRDGGSVSKSQAINWMRDALKRVKARFAR